MSWAPYDPHGKTTRELVRRAKRLLVTDGKPLTPIDAADGTRVVSTDQLFIYSDTISMSIRLQGEGLQLNLVYAENSRGETTSRYPPMLEKTLLIMRQLMVLDDIASI